MINAIISKFTKYRQNRLSFQPLNKPVRMEIYAGTSLDGENQQGLLTLMRSKDTDAVNIISWKSKMSERKAWSTLSGEARVMQHAIDKAAHLKALSKELGFKVMKTTVLTDNLSLRRVIQSGRPTQEQGLRKDVAIIRDQIVYNENEVRFVKSPAMLADHLTQERTGDQLYSILKNNRFLEIKKFDAKQVTPKATTDAAIVIPLADDQTVFHVNVEALYEVIGESQESSSHISSIASNIEDEQPEEPSRLTFGRKASAEQNQNHGDDLSSAS